MLNRLMGDEMPSSLNFVWGQTNLFQISKLEIRS
jgi:hypothetical protein